MDQAIAYLRQGLGANPYDNRVRDRLRQLGEDPDKTAPLPPGIDEMLFAGFLRKKPVHLVKAKTVDVEVPEDAEIVVQAHFRLEHFRRIARFLADNVD